MVTISGASRAMIEFEMVESYRDFPYYMGERAYASTTYYDINQSLIGLIQHGTADWYYTTIYFAKDTLTEAGYIDQVSVIRSIANHEIGHALGLAHEIDDNGVIMFTPYEDRTATVPTLDDLEGIWYLYGD